MYSRWEKDTDTATRLAYNWVGGDDGDPDVTAVADRNSIDDARRHHICEWDIYLDAADDGRVYTFDADDAPADLPEPPADNKRDAVAFLSWWVRAHPSPLGTIAAATDTTTRRPVVTDGGER